MADIIRDINLNNPTQRQYWQTFLSELDIDNFNEKELIGIEKIVGLFDGERLVGTGAIAGKVLKYIGVCDRGATSKGARFNQVMTTLENYMATLGRFHHFVFTKPRYIASFKHIGFGVLAESSLGAILEKGLPDVHSFIRQLPQMGNQTSRIAAVVVNANPFTRGHRYLIEKAATENDFVYVFVVAQDVSLFTTAERQMLVSKSVADLKNVVVVSGGDYMVSYLTFPSYFIHDETTVIDYQTTLDARLFKNIIAPARHITRRYVGSEPLSETTAHYNQTLAREFDDSIELTIVPRLNSQRQVVSARAVREAIATDNRQVWTEMVPETTALFISENITALQTRIRKGQKIDGN